MDHLSWSGWYNFEMSDKTYPLHHRRSVRQTDSRGHWLLRFVEMYCKTYSLPAHQISPRINLLECMITYWRTKMFHKIVVVNHLVMLGIFYPNCPKYWKFFGHLKRLYKKILPRQYLNHCNLLRDQIVQLYGDPQYHMYVCMLLCQPVYLLLFQIHRHPNKS